MAMIRIWHASRDPYHCAFRLVRLLLNSAGMRVAFERLRLLDLFLLFPVALHDVSMPKIVRDRFRDLEIPKAADLFVRLPGNAILAQDLRLYQTTAASQLAARGLLSTEPLEGGYAQLEIRCLPSDLLERANQKNAAEAGLIEFLTRDLDVIPLAGKDGLFRRAGVASWDRLS
jgi:hypothetical protein